MSAAVTLGLIGGTGLTELDDGFETLDINTPYGAPSAPVRVLPAGPVRLLFLPRHGSPHRYPPHKVNYRANIWTLKESGVDSIIAVAAVGGIRADMRPEVLAIPDQIIDYTWSRRHTYFESDLSEVTHIDFTEPYDRALRLISRAQRTLAGVLAPAASPSAS